MMFMKISINWANFIVTAVFCKNCAENKKISIFRQIFKTYSRVEYNFKSFWQNFWAKRDKTKPWGGLGGEPPPPPTRGGQSVNNFC